MREFIAWWFEFCTAGLLELGWIDARTGGLTAFAQFELGGGGIDQLVATAVQANLVEGQSVYFRAATVRAWGRGVGRTGDGDFVQAPGPWGDSDTAADLERARSVVSMLRPNGQTVTGTVPHLRVQSWWRCDAPICDGAAVRALNGRVVRLFGGDGAVVNPSRLMRLAGSIAWPRKEGRIAEVTRFVRPGAGEGRPGAYRLALLHQQLPAEGAAPASVPAALQGPIQAAGVGTVSQLLGAIRSGRGWHDSVVRLVAHWVGRGWSTAEILAAGDSFTLPGWTVEQTRAEVGKAIEGARGKWSVPDVDGVVGDRQGAAGAPISGRIATLANFKATFTAPDYIIEGIVQRGRLYALTGPTGHGKTAVATLLAFFTAAGRSIGGVEVVQAPVLFLAGENPDDLCGRLWAACQEYGLIDAGLPIWVLPGNFPLDGAAAEALRAEIDGLGVSFGMIIGDSLSAFFSGDDENHNVQMGAYARVWRTLTGCRGNPAVLALAHPIKHAGPDSLLPRGGGAFMAEIDGNLTLWAEGERTTTTLHWQGKIRGVDFAPVTFRLVPVALEGKADARGRPFVSVVAQLQTADEAAQAVRAAVSDENVVLEWLRRHPGITVRDIALNAGWTVEGGKPHTSKVARLLASLGRLKLARKWRGKWQITDLGRTELSSEKGG